MAEDRWSKDLDELLAEADELIRQINDDVVNNMAEEQRLKVEIHLQNLKKIQSELQGNVDGGKDANLGYAPTGANEAIHDITKAMGAVAKYLS